MTNSATAKLTRRVTTKQSKHYQPVFLRCPIPVSDTEIAFGCLTGIFAPTVSFPVTQLAGAASRLVYLALPIADAILPLRSRVPIDPLLEAPPEQLLAPVQPSRR